MSNWQQNVDVVLGYTIRWRLHENGLSIDFKAFPHAYMIGYGQAPEYRRADCPGMTRDIDAAEPEFDGFVKWDHCAEVGRSVEGRRFHLCGVEGLDKLHMLLRRVYEIAEAAMGDRWLR